MANAHTRTWFWRCVWRSRPSGQQPCVQNPRPLHSSLLTGSCVCVDGYLGRIITVTRQQWQFANSPLCPCRAHAAPRPYHRRSHYCRRDSLRAAYTTVRKPIGSDSSIINYLRAIFNTPTSHPQCTHTRTLRNQLRDQWNGFFRSFETKKITQNTRNLFAIFITQ